MSKSKQIEEKVTLLGGDNIGKSCLINRFVSGNFDDYYTSTIGAAFFTKMVPVNDVTVKLNLWDTAGQERFRSLAPMYYRGAGAVIIVLDVTEEASFEEAKGWVGEIKANLPDCLLCIAANKFDRSSDRRVSKAEISEYATEVGAALFETSAKYDIGVTEMFTFVARETANPQGTM